MTFGSNTGSILVTDSAAGPGTQSWLLVSERTTDINMASGSSTGLEHWHSTIFRPWTSTWFSFSLWRAPSFPPLHHKLVHCSGIRKGSTSLSIFFCLYSSTYKHSLSPVIDLVQGFWSLRHHKYLRLRYSLDFFTCSPASGLHLFWRWCTSWSGSAAPASPWGPAAHR